MPGSVYSTGEVADSDPRVPTLSLYFHLPLLQPQNLPQFGTLGAYGQAAGEIQISAYSYQVTLNLSNLSQNKMLLFMRKFFSR